MEKKLVKHPKWIVLAAVSLAVVGIAAAIAWSVLTPKSAVSEQEKSYNEAKHMISIGQYEKAYFLLQDCITVRIDAYQTRYVYFEDTKQLLSDFLVLCRESTRCDENGELTYKQEVICEEELGKITYITDKCNGDAPTSYSEEYKAGELKRKTKYDADGNVISYSEYGHDAAGNLIEETFFNASGDVTGHKKYEYDSYGNEIANYKNGELQNRCEYQFDKDGRVIVKTTYNSLDRVISCDTYEYDSYGRCINHMTGDGQYRQAFDDGGRLTSYGSYDADGNAIASYEYEYDQNGNIAALVRYNTGEVKESSKYKYDGNGNLIDMVRYDANGTVMVRSVLNYDKDGNRIKLIGYDTDGNSTGRDEYGYDEYGRRTWEANYDAEGKVRSEKRWSDYTIVYLPEFGK